LATATTDCCATATDGGEDEQTAERGQHHELMKPHIVSLICPAASGSVE
jgi:hypothetical protein